MVFGVFPSLITVIIEVRRNFASYVISWFKKPRMTFGVFIPKFLLNLEKFMFWEIQDDHIYNETFCISYPYGVSKTQKEYKIFKIFLIWFLFLFLNMNIWWWVLNIWCRCGIEFCYKCGKKVDHHWCNCRRSSTFCMWIFHLCIVILVLWPFFLLFTAITRKGHHWFDS